MNKDFVTFELAKKLKEKGFPQDITEKSYFIGDNEKRGCRIGDFVHHPVENKKHLIAAPTISQVLKWLRDTHKLYLSPCVIADYQDDFHRDITYWSFIVINIESGDSVYREYDRVTETRYDNYETSAVAGIEYVLDNLI